MGTSCIEFGGHVSIGRARWLRETAKQLSQMADEIESSGFASLKTPEASLMLREEEAATGYDFSTVAGAVYRNRRLRERHFPSAFFGEAAWDILLDLYAKSRTGETVSVSSSCIASAVPATTALRWLRLLEEGGYVERFEHHRDSRVTLIRLSDSGQAKMDLYFAKLDWGAESLFEKGGLA